MPQFGRIVTILTLLVVSTVSGAQPAPYVSPGEFWEQNNQPKIQNWELADDEAEGKNALQLALVRQLRMSLEGQMAIEKALGLNNVKGGTRLLLGAGEITLVRSLELLHRYGWKRMIYEQSFKRLNLVDTVNRARSANEEAASLKEQLRASDAKLASHQSELEELKKASPATASAVDQIRAVDDQLRRIESSISVSESKINALRTDVASAQGDDLTRINAELESATQENIGLRTAQKEALARQSQLEKIISNLDQNKEKLARLSRLLDEERQVGSGLSARLLAVDGAFKQSLTSRASAAAKNFARGLTKVTVFGIGLAVMMDLSHNTLVIAFADPVAKIAELKAIEQALE